MKRLVMQSLAAACMAAAAVPALADATSRVSFGNFVITLTDLNLDDGIAPSMSFIYNGPALVRTESQSWGDIHESYLDDTYGTDQPGLVQAQAVSGWSSSQASVTSASNVGGFTAISAEGTARSGLDGYGSYINSAMGSYMQNGFVLSPNTRVTFSVMADLRVATSMGYNLEADMAERAWAMGALGLYAESDGQFYSDRQEHQLFAEFDVRDDNTTTGVSDSWSGMLSVSFDNTGANSATGALQTYLTTEGKSALWDGVTPAPVPEPGSYAMMLGGLALFGLLTRRRK